MIANLSNTNLEVDIGDDFARHIGDPSEQSLASSLDFVPLEREVGVALAQLGQTQRK